MILPFKIKWLKHIQQIDVKNCDWPWCDEEWGDITKYIIKTWWRDGKLLGFSAFQFGIEDFILISKLIATINRNDGQAVLLDDIEETARKYNTDELRIVVWEHDNFQIKWLVDHGFKAIGLRGKFPDGSDSYEFRKALNDS